MRNIVLFSLVALVGCGDGDRAVRDIGGSDASADTGGRRDTGFVDGGSAEDGGFVDIGTPDVGRPDVGPPDVGPPDVGPPDVGRPDTGTMDGGPADVGRDAPDVGRDTPPPPMCPSMDLGMALGTVAMGSTEGGASGHSPSCGFSESAPDVGFTWTAPTTGMYVFDTNGSSFDTLLEVRTGSCGGPSLGCDDDGGFGTQSLITLSLTAGDMLVVIVEGYSSRSGNYMLSINPSSPEICDNMIDDDRDGDTDCVDPDCSSEDACSEQGEECFDGGDNDDDGAFDCDDFDCFEECEERGNCADGRDNDEDGDADCSDIDCSCDPVCRGVIPVCPDTDLGSTLGVVASGTVGEGTCGDRTDSSCGASGPGPEIEYMWTAPSAGTYEILTTDGGGSLLTYDTVLSIREAACDGAELTCNDDSSDRLSRVTVTLATSQVIIIVLDAYSETSSGDYELTINAL